MPKKRPLPDVSPPGFFYFSFFMLILLIICVGFSFAVTMLGFAAYYLLEVISYRVGEIPTFGFISLLIIGVFAGRHQLRLARRRAVIRWGEQNGWSVVGNQRAWPWVRQPYHVPGNVAVDFALTGEAGGHPVTVGEVRWKSDGFDGVVEQSQGHVVFAVMKLQQAYSAASIRRRRATRYQGFEEKFDQEYRILLADERMIDRLASVELKAAHVAGRVPPWMIVEDEIYAVVDQRTLRPDAVIDFIARMLLLVELLEIPPPEDSDDPAP